MRKPSMVGCRVGSPGGLRMILPETNAISQLLQMPLGPRPSKPRAFGLTMVIDNIGIYGEDGQIEESVLNEIVTLLPRAAQSLVMWEAPKKSQQLALIRRFGPDVNLGNIAPNEALAVECLRLGLRGDTLACTLP
ncbi:MAG: phosphosulfolactate synthase [Alicyclobacillus sp.]|nr:phosphosulfolactate synthase [Alicyclobacillus sp.]